MNHVQKRLVSTAAKLTSISPASIASFPPKESLKLPKDAFVQEEFNPENWAHLQPAPSTALVAFANRIGLASIFSSTDVMRQACTHSSFLTLFRQHYPGKPEPKTNAQLTVIGNSLMGLFATEYLHAKYPYLPTRVLKAAVSAHMGATPLLRNLTPVLHSDAMASIPRSLTALIYQEPLLEMVQKYGREPPKSRLLKETGRFSNSPVFVVGIFSGADKLGEGFGASLRMAEFRAAEDALMRVYLTQTPQDMLQLPSSTFPSVQGDGEYVAPEIAPSELLYASSGRSGLRTASQS
ncbi:hypothetical protein BDZ97DRAFT_1953043 [Flammula alnicola]|nr:hypothetical protein BDZ97DRAFT_1953043 [Flammula alnicola]